ncbi:MAG: hypothetical protein LBO75_01370, partial [Bifidobacteriaceae bacterium]|nr:hypothetical protein [Bifidobacteriaceae bacterium]
ALRPDGLYLANCGDLAGLPRSRAEIRILGEQFPYVGLITEPSQLRGRRLGNVVLLARKEPFSPEVEDQLSRSLLRVTFPARLVAGPEALRWAGIDVSP